jgi:hypothetical protein
MRRTLIQLQDRVFGASMHRFALRADPAGGVPADPAPEPTAKTYTEDDIAGLKAKIAEKIAENKKLASRAAVIGERTPEEVQADLEFAAKAREEKAKASGQLDEWKKQVTDQFTAEKSKLSTRAAKVEGKLYDVLAKREAEAAIAAAGGNPKVLLPHILPFIKVTEQDDDFAAQVVDAKGNVRIADAQGTTMTIAQLVDTFKADETFGVAFAPSGAAGSGSRNDGGTRSNGAIVVIPKNATPQEYRRLKDEATKRGVAYAIAS